MSLEETAEYLLSEVPAHQLKKAAISNTPYDASSWNGVIGIAPSKNAIRDKIETLTTDIDGKQDLSEKGEPDGYCGLNANGVVSENYLGQVLEDFSVKHKKVENYSTYLADIQSWYGLHINKVDDNCGHVYFSTYNGDFPIITSIYNEEQSYVDGDLLIVQNRSLYSTILRRNNVYSQGFPLDFEWEFDEMVMPIGATFIARYNSSAPCFDIFPLWTQLEDRYGVISGSDTIDDENYYNYIGRTIYVAGDSDVTIENVPHGFNATFIQIGTGDVEFLVSDLTLFNRQSHTKIAGNYGVVGVKVERNNDYLILFGDTKA